LLVAGKWIEYDDDSPLVQREEDITKLSGGGKIAVIWTYIIAIYFALAYKCKQTKDTGNYTC
jgi:hypothetical protein